MSTRATYGIYDKDGSYQVFYIHHDGYPEGASEYFRLMLDYMKDNNIDSYIEAFSEANERSEITESHDVHGDTEYQYQFNNGHLFCWGVIDGFKFAGRLCDFLKEYNMENLLKNMRV